MVNARSIWTRDGAVKLGATLPRMPVGREERVDRAIAEYTDTLPVALRAPTHDVYVRAYRRAGLIPGNPDEIDTVLPPEAPEKSVDPAAATDPPTDPPQAALDRTSGPGDGSADPPRDQP
jgi:hypothetical protein